MQAPTHVHDFGLKPKAANCSCPRSFVYNAVKHKLLPGVELNPKLFKDSDTGSPAFRVQVRGREVAAS